VLLAAACWGTSGIFVRFVSVSSEITALALAFWRDLFSFVVLLAGVGLFRPGGLRVQRRDLPWLLGFGGSLGVFHVFWNLGVMLNGPAVATVQQAAMPAIVAVAAWLLWHESLTWNKILAIVLTFAGTVLVSDLDALGQAKVSLSGLLVGLGIPLTYAAWTLFGKKVREHYGPLESLAFGFGVGALVLLPFQFFTPQPWPVPLVSWLWFAGLIFVSTAFGFSMYAIGLGRLPASVASILAMTEIPIVQGLMGAGMLKGPALAFLLAGPAVSLPNILILRSVIGTKKTTVYLALVLVMATLTGALYGLLAK